MRTMKIVADSSANMISLDAVSFASAPLKVITDGREFVDDAAASANEMLQYFDTYKGKSKTSCPNTVDWLDAFGDAEDIFCVTITSGLSGSYNSACVAKQVYEADYPDRRVLVIDSLSAGPELVLIIKAEESYSGRFLLRRNLCKNQGIPGDYRPGIRFGVSQELRCQWKSLPCHC